MKTIIDLLTLEEKQKVKIVNLKKVQILFNEDEECTSVGVVLEGRISISSFSYEGNERVYNY